MTYSDEGVRVLESFFKEQADSLQTEIALGPGITITNVPLFIQTQFTVIGAASGKISGRLAFDRLALLHRVLTGVAEA